MSVTTSTSASSSSASSISPLAVASSAACWRRIGCLGGGQLGRMLALAAAPLGAKVTVLDPSNACPAAQVCSHISGSFSDPAAIAQLAAVSDVLTVEIEHVDADALEKAQKEKGIPVHPSPSTIRLIQDKYLQKQHMMKYGVSIGRYTIIQNKQQIEDAVKLYGLPLMLKSRRLAYDGRGNFLLRSADDIDRAISTLTASAKPAAASTSTSTSTSPSTTSDLMLYAEEYVPFECELAVMVARAMDGTTRTYPCVTTVQRDNICHTVWAPALVDGAIRKRAEELSAKAIQALDGAGVYGVELFMLKDGSLLLNEIAPRPHNSGHYTIEACETSQFEQQARAVLGLPLGNCDMRVGAAVMVNVLGTGSNNPTVDLANTWLTCASALTTSGGSVHWYGKSGVVKGRKLGHVTLTASSTIELLERYTHLTHLVSQFTQATTDAPEHKTTDGTSVTLPPLVGIIMGSDSDLPTMKAAAEILTEFSVPFELTIVSAHRTPDRLVSYARSARSRGIKVIIAAAGGAAHLPGMVAALTPLPVIGVPIPLTHLDGVDSLYSIVQMPRGVPCATVAIGNSTNGALLAVRMLSTSMPHLADHMERYQANMEKQVMDKVEKIQQQGWKIYKP